MIPGFEKDMMLRYLLRSLLLAAATLFAVATVTFFMVALSPGIWEGDTERTLSRDKIMELKKDLHVEKALFFDAALKEKAFKDGRVIQPWHAVYNFLCAANGYVPYMKNLLFNFDFGMSRNYEGRSVLSLIRNLLPVSFSIGLTAFILTLVVGVPLGTLAAVRQNSALDAVVMSLVALGVSIPSFILAMALVIVFSFKLNLFPPAGWGRPEHLVLPSVVLAAPFIAYVAKLTRASMLDVMRMDYIRTARAKGLSEGAVIAKHALRTAIIPVVNFMGPAAAMMATGSVVVERVFAIPGLGQQFVKAALGRDVRLVCGLTIVYSALIIFFNMATDVIHRFLDPTVSERSAT